MIWFVYLVQPRCGADWRAESLQGSRRCYHRLCCHRRCARSRLSTTRSVIDHIIALSCWLGLRHVLVPRYRPFAWRIPSCPGADIELLLSPACRVDTQLPVRAMIATALPLSCQLEPRHLPAAIYRHRISMPQRCTSFTDGSTMIAHTTLAIREIACRRYVRARIRRSGSRQIHLKDESEHAVMHRDFPADCSISIMNTVWRRYPNRDGLSCNGTSDPFSSGRCSCNERQSMPKLAA